MQLLVDADSEPFPLPLKLEVVTLVVPPALHPWRVTFTLAVSGLVPVKVKAGLNPNCPVAPVQDTVPVPATGGEPADAAWTPTIVIMPTGRAKAAHPRTNFLPILILRILHTP